MSDVVSGLALSRAFFFEAVAPIVKRVAPDLRFTAGRFGTRSDAAGFDDAVSRDHGWGPCCTLLLDPDAFEQSAPRIDSALRSELPIEFRGYSTSYRDGNRVTIEHPPVDHDVDLTMPARYLRHTIGVESVSALRPIDWLAIDEQRLHELTTGELFVDDLGFAAVRSDLAFYPEDLRLHLIAVEWMRIAEEQAFPGRAASRGDHVGATIVLARLAESVLRLGFYLERVYPPYAKWLGTAFRQLRCADALYEPIARAIAAPTIEQRDREWAHVLRTVLELHQHAGLIERDQFEPAAIYQGRPGVGIAAFGPSSITELIAAIRARITDLNVLALHQRLGSINQMVASRDLEENAEAWRSWFRSRA